MPEEADYRSSAAPSAVSEIIRAGPPAVTNWLALLGAIVLVVGFGAAGLPLCALLGFAPLLAGYLLDGGSSVEISLRPGSGTFELVTRHFLTRTRRAVLEVNDVVGIDLVRTGVSRLDRILLRLRDGRALDLFGRPLLFEPARAHEMRDRLQRSIDRARVAIAKPRTDGLPEERAEEHGDRPDGAADDRTPPRARAR